MILNRISLKVLIGKAAASTGEPVIFVSFRLAGRAPFSAVRSFAVKWLEGRRLADARWQTGGGFILRRCAGSTAGVLVIPASVGTLSARTPLENHGFTFDFFRTIEADRVDAFLALCGLDSAQDSTLNARFAVSVVVPSKRRRNRSSCYLTGPGRALVDRIHLALCEGSSLHELARTFEAEGVRTPTGRKLTPAQILYLVRWRKAVLGSATTPEPKTPLKPGRPPKVRTPMPILFGP